MTFFKQLSEIIDGIDVTMTVRKSENELTILLQPKAAKEGTKATIKPLTIKGTPEELDEQFFNIIFSSAQKAKGIIANIVDFEKDMENVKKAVEEEAKKKREASNNKKQTVSINNVSPKNEGTEEETGDVKEVKKNPIVREAQSSLF